MCAVSGLFYDAQSTIVTDEQVDAAVACTDGVCSMTPSTILERGGYRWQVRAQNDSGPGPWSQEISFVVGLLPGTATLVSPQGDGIETQPIYIWNEVSDTTQYQVQVADEQDVVMVNVWVDAAGACVDGACQVTPSTSLARGGYHWSVRTKNTSSLGPWSAPMDFVVGKLPGAAVLFAPTGSDVTLPTYRWNEAAEAASYRLLVTSDAGQTVTDRTYLAEDICQEGICQTQAVRLAEGSYSWKVLASNPSGDGPWSVEMSFTAAEPADSRSYDWHYEYDKLNRLTYVCSIWDSVSLACNGDELYYEYDGAGNQTRFDKWNALTSQVETVRYVINGANQITCIDTDASGTCNSSETVWQHDAFGNLLNDGTKAYVYDTANRLSSVTVASSTTAYQYDGDGNRISQTVDSVSTTYVLDTATPLTMVLSETTGSTTIRYWHGLDLIAQSDGTAITYLSYDGLGSVRQLTDTAGAVQLAQTFDPSGSLYSDAGTNSTRYSFTGEYQDSNGLLFLRARYYNAGSGRFTQMDPSRQERNLFQYVGSNPVLNTDPTGLSFRDYVAPNCSGPIWICYNHRLTAIPLINEDGTFPTARKYDWYGVGTSEARWLDAGARRDMAAILAQEWANKSWPDWGKTGSDIPDLDENGKVKDKNDISCVDCTRFVSYILWRVGFIMKSGHDKIRYPKSWHFNGAYLDDGWWANVHIGGGQSSGWAQVPKFRVWWISQGAQETTDLSRLKKGDVILYNYDDVGSDPWDHVVMVVDPVRQGLDKPMVASRGAGDCDSSLNLPASAYDTVIPQTWWWQPGDPLAPKGPTIVGLIMPYELNMY